MSFCTKCGNQLSANAHFCVNCGSPASSEDRQAPISPKIKEAAPQNIGPAVAAVKSSPGRVKYYLMVASALILLVSNPSATDFEIFLSSQLNQRFPQSQEEDNFLSNLLQGAVKNIAADYLKQSTERSNYFLFSTYTVNLSGIQSFVGSLPPSAKFLGIFGNFIPLSDIPKN